MGVLYWLIEALVASTPVADALTGIAFCESDCNHHYAATSEYPNPASSQLPALTLEEANTCLKRSSCCYRGCTQYNTGGMPAIKQGLRPLAKPVMIKSARAWRTDSSSSSKYVATPERVRAGSDTGCVFTLRAGKEGGSANDWGNGRRHPPTPP